MGKLIDTDKLKDIIEYCILANVPADAENTMEEKWNDWFQTVIDRAQPVEAIPKADYEARLKADMVAMLAEIQLEIEELPTHKMPITDSSGLICYGYSEYEPTAKDASKVILQKINALKAESEDEEENV